MWQLVTCDTVETRRLIKKKMLDASRLWCHMSVSLRDRLPLTRLLALIAQALLSLVLTPAVICVRSRLGRRRRLGSMVGHRCIDERRVCGTPRSRPPPLRVRHELAQLLLLVLAISLREELLRRGPRPKVRLGRGRRCEDFEAGRRR